jgi:low affinity Fe/Cu permease
VHTKLDELFRADAEARGDLATLDKQEPDEIIRHRIEQRNLIGRSRLEPVLFAGELID